jgi:hypothetical protein
MSQQSISLLSVPVLATAALTGRRFATIGGALPAAGGKALGVAKYDAAIGEYVPLDVMGTTIVEAGAAVAAGARVKVTAAGKAITATTGTTVMGVALEAASGDGTFFECLLATVPFDLP